MEKCTHLSKVTQLALTEQFNSYHSSGTHFARSQGDVRRGKFKGEVGIPDPEMSPTLILLKESAGKLKHEHKLLIFQGRIVKYHKKCMVKFHLSVYVEGTGHR